MHLLVKVMWPVNEVVEAMSEQCHCAWLVEDKVVGRCGRPTLIHPRVSAEEREGVRRKEANMEGGTVGADRRW